MRSPKYLAALAGFTSLTGGLTACVQPVPPPAVTIAVTGSSHEPAASIATLIPVVKEHALAANRPKEGAVRVVVQGHPATYVDLTPMRGEEVETDPTTAADLVAGKLKDLATVVSAGASTDGNDTLGVLDQAIEATPVGGSILMLSSGISTVDPVDLNQAGDWIGNPDRFVANIERGNLPDATGRAITFIGIGYGDPSGNQPTAGPAIRNALRTIWQGICRAAHASSCTITDGPAGTEAPTATNTVPTVNFTPVTTHCVAGTITVNSDVAFHPQSASLKMNADHILKPIAASLAGCPAGARVNTYGHAATVPGAGNGIKLSLRRAQHVLDRLQALGAPVSVIGKATGFGNTSHQPVNNMPGGTYSEELARRNRIVEVVITIS